MEDIQWDDANRAHIARHGINAAEVEQVLSGDAVEVEEQVLEEETRLVWIGETSRGRIVQVVFTERSGRIRPVTAFDPDPSQPRKYLRAKAGLS